VASPPRSSRLARFVGRHPAALAVTLTLAAVALAPLIGSARHAVAPAGGAAVAEEPMPLIATADCPDTAGRATPEAQLPDLTLPCLGHPGAVRLRGLVGQPAVVNLWASWCQPFRSEMPTLQRLHQAAGGAVRLLGVASSDTERAARATIQATGVRYPSLLDLDGAAKRDLGAFGLPLTLFVSADGRVVHRKLGEMTYAQMRSAVRDHLGVTVPAD
jgi:cytochrome c biogenesis protein CcmG/thiol:disulfide interchange protein DsbE